MLSILRKHAKHWIIGIIIFAIGIVFVLSYGFGGLHSGPTQEVAVVNGQPITITAYARQLNAMIKQYQEMSRSDLTPELIKAMRLKEMAVDRLIAESLLMQAAERQGLTVSDADLRKQIENYPFFQRNGKFDEHLYFMMLAQNQMSSTEFEEEERQDLELRKITTEVTSLAKVSDAQIRETYDLAKEAVQVSYLVVTPDKFMASQHPSEAELSRYYQTNQEKFRVPARARVSYLYFPTQDFQDRVKISDAEVANIIKEHPAEFLRPKVVQVRQLELLIPPKADAATRQRLEKQAQDLLDKLKAGADFAKLAQNYSQDPASQAAGGELGDVQRGQHPPQWDLAAFGLKPGEVGRADTPQAIYLLKMEGVKETEKIPGAETRLRDRLKQEKALPLAQEAAQQARAALSQDPAAEVAKKYGGSLKETPLISQKDQVPGLGPAPAFTQAALQLKPGETSRVVELPGGFAVMKSLEYQVENLPPFSQVKDQVAQQVKKQGAMQDAEKEATQLLARLRKGEPLDQVAAAAGLAVKVSSFFTRFQGFDGQRQAEALTGAAFLLSREHPYPDRPLDWNEGCYLLAYKEKRPADQAELQKNWEKLKTQLLDEKKQMMLVSWLDAERRRAKIKVYELPGGE
ncbi:MAG: SurA N-terminal domain-containing protein [Desulfobaccales bacterium]